MILLDPKPCERLCALSLVLASLGIWLAEGQARADTVTVDPAVVSEVRAAIGALDDEEFAARDLAARRLAGRIADPRLASFLASEFAQVLLSTDTSFEARTRIEALRAQLPLVPPAPPDALRSASQIAPLVDQLSSDSYAARDSAKRRIRSMLSHVELIGPTLVELKRRMAERALTAESRRALEPLLDEAREAWLAGNPARVQLPDVSSEKISGWVEDATQLEQPENGDRYRREMAERELLDLIARDDTRSRVLEILGAKIAAAPDAAARTTLESIADFAKPAMVAEVWANRMHLTVQYLLVDVPQINEPSLGNPHATRTHFDRIDDHIAHCVSGASLTEGDYPVRIAIGHPEPNHEVMFYLTNLPTARRRLLYEYQVKRDESVRLREISQRTVDYFVAQQRALDQTQVLILAQLDPSVVSEFVGRYFRMVPNQRLFSSTTELQHQLTVHAGICYVLARVGTREAVPALEQLARSGRLGKASFENPYQMAWIAALAIAQRDPWPQVDPWLASLVDQDTPLAISVDPPPQLGATAAATLLDRHGLSTRAFGLEATNDVLIGQYRFIGYRFASAKDRQDVGRWWQKQKHAPEGADAP
jgi:hypothetical protein